MEYCMTEAELEEVLSASRAPMAIIAGVSADGKVHGLPRDPQESANDVWARLGDKYRFQWDTARPVPGKGPRYFTAEPLVEGAEDEQGEA